MVLAYPKNSKSTKVKLARESPFLRNCLYLFLLQPSPCLGLPLSDRTKQAPRVEAAISLFRMADLALLV